MFTDMFDAMEVGREPAETFYDGYVVNAVMDACPAPRGPVPGSRSSWTGAEGSTPRVTRQAQTEDGLVVVKEEQLPDGRRKLVLITPQTSPHRRPHRIANPISRPPPDSTVYTPSGTVQPACRVP